LKELNISSKQRERDRLRKLAHVSQGEYEWEKFRSIRNEIKRLIKTAKSSFYKRALSSKRPKEVWSTIHCILHPSLQRIDADPNILNEHFNTTAERLLNSKPKPENVLHDLIRSLPEQNNPFRIKNVTHNDVKKTILSLRNDCSTGPDQIPSKFLKICVDEITSPLCYIINSSINEQTFPVQWKISKISPIPKVHLPKEPNDYRPISILLILFPRFMKGCS